MSWILSSSDGDWTATRLDSPVIDLLGEAPLAADASARAGGGGPLLMRTAAAGTARDRWVLVAAARDRVRVNGLPVTDGIRVLDDRDEIVIRDRRMFLSMERIAGVEPFPGIGRVADCARCGKVLLVGQPAVRCPGCGVWHHEAEPLRCWTHAATCRHCSTPTALGGGLRWLPDGR